MREIHQLLGVVPYIQQLIPNLIIKPLLPVANTGSEATRAQQTLHIVNETEPSIALNTGTAPPYISRSTTTAAPDFALDTSNSQPAAPPQNVAVHAASVGPSTQNAAVGVASPNTAPNESDVGFALAPPINQLRDISIVPKPAPFFTGAMFNESPNNDRGGLLARPRDPGHRLPRPARSGLKSNSPSKALRRATSMQSPSRTPRPIAQKSLSPSPTIRRVGRRAGGSRQVDAVLAMHKASKSTASKKTTPSMPSSERRHWPTLRYALYTRGLQGAVDYTEEIRMDSTRRKPLD